MPTWSRHEVHWHMFRHGCYVMMMLQGATDAECGQKLTMEPSTMRSYRAHISRFIGASMEQRGLSHVALTALHDDAVARLASEVQSTIPGIELTTLTSELHSLLGYLRLAPEAFKNMRACFRQVFMAQRVGGSGD